MAFKIAPKYWVLQTLNEVIEHVRLLDQIFSDWG